MNPQTQPQQPHNPLAVMQPGEQFICEIKRHPIGIISIFVASAILILLFALVIFLVLPQVMPDTSNARLYSIGGSLYLLLVVLTLGFVFIANKVYWGNRWIVTSDSVTQVTQTSLFNRQSSQLSLGNLEDIVAEQNGIMTHIFNYGVIKVETAGERSKFVFVYCPNPNYYAKQILDARERFEQFSRANEIQALYQQGAFQHQQNPQAQPPAGPPAV